MRNDEQKPLSKCLDYCLMETPFYKTLKKDYFQSSEKAQSNLSLHHRSSAKSN
jgi:hypothetical protein